MTNYHPNLARRLSEDAANPPRLEALVAAMITGHMRFVAARLEVQAESRGPEVYDAIVRALAREEFRCQPDAADLLIGLLPDDVIRDRAQELAAAIDAPKLARHRLLALLAGLNERGVTKRIARDLKEQPSGMAPHLVRALEHQPLPTAVQKALHRPLQRGVDRAASEPCAVALAHLDPKFVERLLLRARCFPHGESGLIAAIAQAGLPLPQDQWNDLLRLAMGRGAHDYAAVLVPFATLPAAELEAWVPGLRLAVQMHAADGRREDPRATGCVRAYAAILQTLARDQGEGAMDFLREALTVDCDGVCNIASSEMARLAGLPEDYLGRLNPNGSLHVARLACCSMLHSLVKNGGLWQIHCLDDLEAEILPSALDAIAPVAVQEIVRRAIDALYGANGLPRDNAARAETLIGPGVGELELMDKAYFAADHLFEVGMDLFAIEHRKEVLASLVPEGVRPGRHRR